MPAEAPRRRYDPCNPSFWNLDIWRGYRLLKGALTPLLSRFTISPEAPNFSRFPSVRHDRPPRETRVALRPGARGAARPGCRPHRGAGRAKAWASRTDGGQCGQRKDTTTAGPGDAPGDLPLTGCGGIGHVQCGSAG